MSSSSAPEFAFDVESFIREYYDAWSGTDLDRIMSYYVEDVVIQIPGLIMKGKKAVRDQFAQPFTADRVQLQQVLMNLMLNGIEAMSADGGELKISTRFESEEVIASVSDTGEGIPDDKMEEIFHAFVTTKAGGTGMGLAISSAIIESHSGGIWATVNPEHRATFHFTLPTQPGRQSEH